MIRGFFLILIVFLFACSKEKRAYNKLDGIWEVTQARIVDGQGFTFYDDPPWDKDMMSEEAKLELGFL